MSVSIEQHNYHAWGSHECLSARVIFVDGEVKSANFDTKGEPLDLGIYNEGSITLKVAGKADAPVLNVNVVALDHKTGEPRVVGSFTEMTENGSRTIRITDLTREMAIDATLAGGSFTVTITGEFFRK